MRPGRFVAAAVVVLIAQGLAPSSGAATLRVPKEHATIQAAVDSASVGDVILVAPGTYAAKIRLRAGIVLRSEGDEGRGVEGLRRAEATILDGRGIEGDAPGVVMAEGSTLDGFTITNVGGYDEAIWKRHFDSHGEELGDEEGSVQAEGTRPAIGIDGVNCTVARCIVHHNGDVGIGMLGKPQTKIAPLITENCAYRNMGGGIGAAEGADAIVRGNLCRENLRAGIGCRRANPILENNVCFQNVRAGIGCREGAKPLIRGNKCYRNRRAGIGIRMSGTAPIVDDNECYENDMAGIGCRDGAEPVLRGNLCRNNKMAGIGCRDGARPLIVGNVCRENDLAGIGVQGGAIATIRGNKCLQNKLVAVGIVEASTATLLDNELSRTGGVPPIVAVKDDSQALLRGNRISGGGVAAVLVQGRADLSDNTFTGSGEKQGQAVWVWEGSTATIAGNTFDGYRAAVNAAKAAEVVVARNTIRNFHGTAIVVKESRKPAHVFGNSATTADEQAKIVEVQGPSGVVVDNEWIKK